ncbi:hypothetical protein F441_13426 [Phytophthora nicotianae CJ01A1]|uniref:Uncharacterized protein n=2 Tax=Phytophthora nicotianae TaxID=4792 RepID=W2GE19_PHYNI|nr:hypothetical protein L915_13181 [Phytophthora nicotianae]ETL34744.1 hypothetical protein L916_13068 [Phytophthora nicotianae]ETP11035.1 hypothetical protein F441_13426 [Phytophthora nicotianae CJ01A1]
MAMVGESNGNFTGSGMNGDDGNNSAVAKVATTDAILGWIGRCFSSDGKNVGAGNTCTTQRWMGMAR